MKRQITIPTLAILLYLLSAMSTANNTVCQQLLNWQQQNAPQQANAGFDINLRVLRNQSYSTYTYSINSGSGLCASANTASWQAVCLQIQGASEASLRVDYFYILPSSFTKITTPVLMLQTMPIATMQQQLSCSSYSTN